MHAISEERWREWPSFVSAVVFPFCLFSEVSRGAGGTAEKALGVCLNHA